MPSPLGALFFIFPSASTSQNRGEQKLDKSDWRARCRAFAVFFFIFHINHVIQVPEGARRLLLVERAALLACRSQAGAEVCLTAGLSLGCLA